MLRKNDFLWSKFQTFFNKEEKIDKTGEVHFMRLFLQFGAPLNMTSKANVNDTSKPGKRYNDITDNEREQKVYVA